MAYAFTPNETFDAEVNGITNRYLKGAKYTVRDHPLYKDLHAKVQKWAKAGTVTLLGEVPNRPPHRARTK